MRSTISPAPPSKGFTIVELLIVIVVIAILATISIVTYNGIQQRAKLARQTAAIDRIGKAIQLWSAEKGMSLEGSGSGASGRGVGAFQQKNNGSYGSVSIEDALRSSGYLTGSNDEGAFAHSQLLLAPCTTYTDTRWAVFATVSPAPERSVADQIAATGCTSAYMTQYTSAPYNRNFIKAY